MSKKQTKTPDTYTITMTREQHYGIKNALFVIEQMNEITCWTPTDSSGFLQVALDMAKYIEKALGIKEED